MNHIIVGTRASKRTRVILSNDGMDLWQVRCVQGYIAVHLHRRIRTEDIARAAQSDRRTLTRVFMMRFGHTPCQYVRRMRIARAQVLMTSSSTPLREIARECGFANLSHLSQCFRKIVGTAPAAWRARHQPRAFSTSVGRKSPDPSGP